MQLMERKDWKEGRPRLPFNFTPAGVVEWARPCDQPAYITKPKGNSVRRSAGIAYERKCQKAFEERWENYLGGQWFEFKRLGEDRLRYCQPDGLMFWPLQGQITIVEFKLQHTEAAWWQTRLLYHPVLLKVFPPDMWQYGFCEVVKWFDPDVYFPGRFMKATDVSMVNSGQFGVHIFKP